MDIIEITTEEYRKKKFQSEYDWITAFMRSNPTWTLDKLVETVKWKQQESRYTVYRISFRNGLSLRTVVRNSDNAEVWLEG